MYDFKIVKTSNDIEDLCVTFGVVALIKNAGEEVLRISDNGSFYNVQTEEFDLRDISEIGYEFEKEDTGEYKLDTFKSCAEFLNKTNINQNASQLESFIRESGEKTLKYLLCLDDEDSKDILKNESTIFCGSVFYLYGLRPSGVVGSGKTYKYKKWLSLLGWIFYVNQIKILKKDGKSLDKIMYFIPRIKKVEQLDKVSWLYSTKEGTVKEIEVVSEESVNTSLAKINLSLLEYRASSEGYYGYYLITMTPTKHKPISDKFLEIDFLDKNINFYTREFLKLKLLNKNMSEEVAAYVLNMKRYSNLSKLIKIMAKKDFYEKNGKRKISYINKEVSEEMIRLQNNEVIKVYKNETVIKLGRGLNRLLNDDKGYQIQVLLLNARNLKKTMSAIKSLTMEYKKAYTSNSGRKINLISEDDINDMFKLLENANSEVCGVVADAIIFNSKIFTNSRENKTNNNDEGDN